MDSLESWNFWPFDLVNYYYFAAFWSRRDICHPNWIHHLGSQLHTYLTYDILHWLFVICN